MSARLIPIKVGRHTSEKSVSVSYAQCPKKGHGELSIFCKKSVPFRPKPLSLSIVVAVVRSTLISEVIEKLLSELTVDLQAALNQHLTSAGLQRNGM